MATEIGTAMKALSDADRVFVHAYLTNGFNKTQAYSEGHPKANMATCAREGHRLTRNPKMRAAIDEYMGGYCLSKEEIFAELAGIALGTDAADLASLLPGVDFDKLREAGLDTRNIRKITYKAGPTRDGEGNVMPGPTISIELHDRHAALVNMGKALTMFGQRSEHRVQTGPGDMSTPEGQIAALEAFEAETKGDE